MSDVEASEKTRRRSKRRRLLTNRNFTCLLAARLGSSMANGFLPVAESFGILHTTGSASDLGLVLGVQAAVSLALSLFAGVAADRFPRAALLIVSSIVRLTAAATLAIGLLTDTATLAWFFALAVIYGGADALFGPASMAIMPDIVAREDLDEANALVGAFSSLAWTVAPAAAGFVVAAYGSGAAFLVESVLMAFITLCLVFAKIPARREAEPEHEGGTVTQLKQGWREFQKRPWLWLLTLQWTLFSMVLLAPLAVLGPLVADTHLGGPAAWGVIGTCMTIGVLCAEFTSSRIKPKRPVVFIAWLPPLIVFEALALGSGVPTVVVAGAAVLSGCAIGLQGVFFQTLMQRAVPSKVLGRVAAFDLMASEIAQPVGFAVAGPLGILFGLRPVLVGCAVVAVVGTALFALALTKVEPPELQAQTEPHVPDSGNEATVG
ncbi:MULTISPECIES: MFS transporter [unclassified Streptomyces]|uniref:MFS transporter n=1 Tax=Streptomyces TaxID=1883 RepID=UPI001371F606|nr:MULTISPECIES: MFS transporter [unclassified Streptomyces]NEA03419.1 MFS transporter [Streptomyces sp. SID10116]MYY83928.1 MFS transporter [Streptomyces sp. SID335]MYZ17771.1 MFS transporter [Streptomyces sp. SID337]NDZ84130.1 MFS transporter [Streptomyces sp. SID10115]NEB44661.1 MFS transporter [Streptomyces sp. SID339]